MTDSPRLPEPPSPAPGARSGSLTRTRLTVTVSRWLHGSLQSGLDLLFPPHCVHCKRSGALLCAGCAASIQPAPIFGRDSALDGRRATAVFDGAIRSAIHAFKYENQPRLADLLAGRLHTELRAAAWTPSVIVPVPLHTERARERGYNQSALLAERLARLSGIAYRADWLSRTRATRPQVGLNAHERQSNVAGAFQAEPGAAGHALLIIDDVYTTGATLRACAEAFRAAGASQVWALTVAAASRP